LWSATGSTAGSFDILTQQDEGKQIPSKLGCVSCVRRISLQTIQNVSLIFNFV